MQFPVPQWTPAPTTPGTRPPGAPWTPPLPPPPGQSHVPGPVSSILPGPGFAPGATFTLTKSLTLTEEYTDNFNLFEEETAQFVGLATSRKVSNFRTSLAGGLTLAIDGARTRGFISAGVSIVYDTATDGLKGSLFPNLDMALSYEITPKLTLLLADSLSRNDDTFRGDPFGVRRQREIFTANSFSATLGWLIDRIQTQLYYRNALFISEGTEVIEASVVDGNVVLTNVAQESTTTVSNILGANAAVPLGPLMTGTIGYEFSISNTTDEAQFIGNLVYAQLNRRVGEFASVGLTGSYQTFTAEEGNIWSVAVNATYGLPTGLSVSGSLGYSQLIGGDRETGTQGGPTTQTQVMYVFPLGATVSVGFFSDFRQSSLTGQDFGLVFTRSYFGAFSYPVNPYLRAAVAVSYSENEFTGGGNVRSSQPLNSLTVSANISYQFLRWLRASAGYNYTRFTGGRAAFVEGLGIINISGEPITENRAYISLNALF
jgi:hypothetical protein